MGAIAFFRRWRRAFFQQRTREREFDRELKSYLDLAIRAEKQKGMSEAEARRTVLLRIGGVEQVKERVRESRIGYSAETLLLDLRYALRSLRRRPGFSIVVIAVLTLGIGANTAVFSLVRGVLLKSLPYPQPERLVAIGETAARGPLTALPYLNYLDWRGQQHVFADLCARLPAGGILTGQGDPERVFGRFVSASFFTTLRLRPQLGRFFTEIEDVKGGERAIIISDALWRRRFGGDPGIIGQAVQYNGGAWTLLGVMPPDFDFYGRANENNDFFIPLGQLEQSDSRGRGYPVRLTARLRDGVTLREARSEIQTLARRAALEHPESDSGNPVDVRPFLSDYVGDSSKALAVISAAVVFLLLIACANVANLTLARAGARQTEIAVRLALGASRGRVIRLLILESLLLALAGATVGTFVAFWGVSVFKSFAPAALPRLEDVQIDGWVLAFTIVAAVGSGVLFGLLPALQTTRPNVDAALKQGGRRSTDLSSKRLRGSLVITELALSLALLIGAGLLVKSFTRLLQVEPGFDLRNVLIFRLRMPDLKYSDPARAIQFLEQTQQRLARLPGVTGVAISTGHPLGRSSEAGFLREGKPEPKAAAQWPIALSFAVSKEYCPALGITLLAGRSFDDRDRAESTPVVIVDEEFAQRSSAGGSMASLLGRRLRLEGVDEPWRQIVGVVRHVKQDGLDESPRPEIYRPWTQLTLKSSGDYLRAMDIVIKSAADPRTLVPAVQREIHYLDSDQPLGPTRLLSELMKNSMAARRVNLVLIVSFAGAALLLSAIGLYGVMNYLVQQRERELGARIALGATYRDILKLVLGQGMMLALIGIVLGLFGSLALSHTLEHLLFGIAATDWTTFFFVPLLLASVTLLATYLPARRATRINPIAALRCE